MNRKMQDRKLFAKVLKENYLAYKRGDLAEVDFIRDMENIEPNFWQRSMSDPSLNAVWYFGDLFIDALHHSDFIHTISNKLGEKFTIENCEQFLDHILKRFEQGLEITHPDLLNFRDLYPQHKTYK